MDLVTVAPVNNVPASVAVGRPGRDGVVAAEGIEYRLANAGLRSAGVQGVQGRRQSCSRVEDTARRDDVVFERLVAADSETRR